MQQTQARTGTTKPEPPKIDKAEEKRLDTVFEAGTTEWKSVSAAGLAGKIRQAQLLNELKKAETSSDGGPGAFGSGRRYQKFLKDVARIGVTKAAELCKIAGCKYFSDSRIDMSFVEPVWGTLYHMSRCMGAKRPSGESNARTVFMAALDKIRIYQIENQYNPPTVTVEKWMDELLGLPAKEPATTLRSTEQSDKDGNRILTEIRNRPRKNAKAAPAAPKGDTVLEHIAHGIANLPFKDLTPNQQDLAKRTRTLYDDVSLGQSQKVYTYLTPDQQTTVRNVVAKLFADEKVTDTDNPADEPPDEFEPGYADWLRMTQAFALKLAEMKQDRELRKRISGFIRQIESEYAEVFADAHMYINIQ